jgi:hypothetical protein
MQGPREGLISAAQSRRQQIGMSKTRRPTSRTAAASKKQAAPSTSPAEVSPLDPAYEERPEAELPVLSFPNAEQHDVEQAAELRRRVRIRNELIFVVVLLVFGLGALAVGRNPAFLALAVISAVAVAAYEVTVAALE